MERGAVTQSQKGKNAYVGVKVGECYQWKSIGQCSKGDSCSFRHDQAFWKQMRGSEKERQKGQASSPAPNAKAQTDGQTPSKRSGSREECPSDASGRIPCRYRGKCTNPSCNCWHPPVCQNYKYESGCKYGNRCYFRHVEADEKPSKNSKKGGAKGSVALLRLSTQLGCVSRDSHSRKSVRDQITPSNSPRVRFTKQKFGRKGPSRGVIQKCEPHERSPCAPRFEERSQDETSHQERCARRLGQKCLQAQEYG